ncbi:hypothetical protein BO83DRAFT_380186 [Aspergillus eucalypticola CBS 122712]|uniref:Uncharacterized protein n=1 Tax=Aspergillus eucalypticola (strain CBS 122712 / IBT 29274) TaxID=1448314 RepID=A0A317V3M4_ASPEC|nr:uncharacterized protein BO83DRAFT_380186 [Aspergillus eucalypticola CBS 122712]PWY68249.1 hypothetical protein BO83DRAFT_380186 [Aspergillus eucalypticola CBS 122712]
MNPIRVKRKNLTDPMPCHAMPWFSLACVRSPFQSSLMLVGDGWMDGWYGNHYVM